MEAEYSLMDELLHNYPIVQIAHIIIVTVSIPPVLIFLTQISKIALHDNCKFLLHAWGSAFFVCLIMHCAFIACDLATGKYIPETNHDPPIRLLIFAIHGFAHAMTSAQELMLSLERAASCASPEEYHVQGLAKRVLLAAEGLSAVVAMVFLWQISSDNIAVACCITNTIDLASLVCLSVTSYYVAKWKKVILCSSLNEKYQVTSSIAPWIYSLGIFESQYMFTLTGGAYFIIESLNCMICCTVVLRKHAGLRKITDRLICRRMEIAISQKQTAEEVSKLYFKSLLADWD